MRKRFLITALIMALALACGCGKKPDAAGPSGQGQTADSAQNPALAEAIVFPDPSFEAAVREIIGKPSGDITKGDAANVTELAMAGKGITNLSGIEYFTALTKLDCGSNQLTKLDVSKNTALTRLYCISNQLTKLDLSKNAALTELYCFNNQLTSLNVSKSAELSVLSCGQNQLGKLDVSKNTAMKALSCRGNKLTSLDVSKNTALKDLWCDDNRITKLDLSKNGVLTALGCDWAVNVKGLDESRTTVERY